MTAGPGTRPCFNRQSLCVNDAMKKQLWKNWFAKHLESSSRTARRPWRCLRPCLEGLETRAVPSTLAATPGNDGTAGSPVAGVLNTYYAGSASAAAGATSIAVGPSSGARATITAGDWLLVIQVQNSQINAINAPAQGNSTGAGSALLGSTAGTFEYVKAANDVGAAGGMLMLVGAGDGGGLLHFYVTGQATATDGQATFEVVRLPQLAKDDTYNVNADTPLTVNALSGVLTNSIGLESQPLTVALITGPVHGALVLNSDGSFTYTPAPGFSGTDTFTYRISDNSTSGAVGTVTLHVAAPLLPANLGGETADGSAFLLLGSNTEVLGRGNDVVGALARPLVVSDFIRSGEYLQPETPAAPAPEPFWPWLRELSQLAEGENRASADEGQFWRWMQDLTAANGNPLGAERLEQSAADPRQLRATNAAGAPLELAPQNLGEPTRFAPLPRRHATPVSGVYAGPELLRDVLEESSAETGMEQNAWAALFAVELSVQALAVSPWGDDGEKRSEGGMQLGQPVLGLQI
jgi:hypothetical protein